MTEGRTRSVSLLLQAASYSGVQPGRGREVGKRREGRLTQEPTPVLVVSRSPRLVIREKNCGNDSYRESVFSLPYHQSELSSSYALIRPGKGIDFLSGGKNPKLLAGLTSSLSLVLLSISESKPSWGEVMDGFSSRGGDVVSHWASHLSTQMKREKMTKKGRENCPVVWNSGGRLQGQSPSGGVHRRNIQKGGRSTVDHSS